MSRWKNRIGWIAVLAAAAAIAGVFYFRRGAKPETRYETVKVDRGRIVARVTATGTLSALVTVQVGSQVSGRIQQIFVDFNSEVKKGQLVAKIDPQLFAAALEQAKANHLVAQANVEKARVQAQEAERVFQRTKALAEKKLVAQSDQDTAQSNALAARAQVAAAEAALAQTRAARNQAEVNLAYTRITSPTDGTVISRSVDVGQTVAASLQAPTLFTIAQDLRKMQVDTNIAEADVGKLRPGMPATFTVDAYGGRPFHGMVRQIRNAPQTVQNVVTYDAVIDVDNSDMALKPGMTTNVTLIHAERADVLRVPNAALRFRAPPDMKGRGGAPGGKGPTRGEPAAPDGGRSEGTVSRASSSVTTVPGGGDRQARSGAPKPDGTGGAQGGGRPMADDTPDRRTVWVLRNGAPERVSIRIGVTDGTMTELLSGELAEGDQLITEVIGGSSTAARPSMPLGAPRPPSGRRSMP